ncbi:MAG: heavy metal-binding domain-containing protein [Caldilineaceae bacterium]|nr:heavy metal-binding domain-containing protein [Caldilineaceae bacterium]
MAQTPVLLLALDHLPADIRLVGADGNRINGPIEVGELLMVVTVMAANVVNDIRENIRNLVGGRMNHYEKLVEMAVQTALDELACKAQTRGYDGVVGVKISHPELVDGGVEVVVYGNGFRARQ